MGHYHGNHLRLKFKDNGDPKAVELFRLLTNREDLSPEELGMRLVDNPYVVRLMSPEVTALLVQERRYGWTRTMTIADVARLNKILTRLNPEFEAYNRRKIDGNTIENFGSHKDNGMVEFRYLLQLMFSEFSAKDGDVLYRSIYENDEREYVLWFDEKNQKIVESEGWRYGETWDDVNHPSHGCNDDGTVALDPFKDIWIPPMNYIELCAAKGEIFSRRDIFSHCSRHIASKRTS